MRYDIIVLPSPKVSNSRILKSASIRHVIRRLLVLIPRSIVERKVWGNLMKVERALDPTTGERIPSKYSGHRTFRSLLGESGDLLPRLGRYEATIKIKGVLTHLILTATNTLVFYINFRKQLTRLRK